LAYIANMIGGGIVSLPFALATVGIPIGLAIHFIVMLVYLGCVRMYFKSKDHLGFESLSELAYLCFGRTSVFLINILICFCVSGIITLYLILLSNLALSIAPQMEDPSLWFLNSRQFYVGVSILILTPFIIKKNFSELKIASVL
jgi:amino acid permease